MSAINTNMSSILAKNALVTNERAMSTAMERLSTGVRINGAKDDAAGLAISSKMTSQIRGLDQAVRNANDAVSLIQTAEGALVQTTNMLQRMRELAVQSASDTNVTADRTALNQEFQQLKAEINRTGANTQWNGTNILDKSFSTNTGNFTFQVGANASQSISIAIGDYATTGSGAGTAVVTTATGGGAAAVQASTLTIGGTYVAGEVVTMTVGEKSYSHTITAANVESGTPSTNHTSIAASLAALYNATGAGVTGIAATAGTDKIDFAGQANTAHVAITASTGSLLSGVRDSAITTQTASNAAIIAVDAAIALVNTGRSEMGAVMNRLQYASDNLAEISANATESRGRILDADYAKETTELARTQIISQAGTAMLAQANQVKQTVLSLLK
jgi:flagellin